MYVLLQGVPLYGPLGPGKTLPQDKNLEMSKWLSAESVCMCYSRVCCCTAPMALVMNAESVCVPPSRVCCCTVPLAQIRLYNKTRIK